MLELLLRFDPKNSDLRSEEEIHHIAQDMSEIVQPHTKLAKMREHIAKRTLVNYIIESGLELRDKRKIEKLRQLNGRLDESELADAKLSFRLAQKFAEMRAYSESLEYLEQCVRKKYAREGAKFLLNLIQNKIVPDEAIPQTLVQALLVADVEPKQLSDLVAFLPKKPCRLDHPSDYVRHLRTSVELGNDVSAIMTSQLNSILPALPGIVDQILDDREITDRLRHRLVARVSSDLTLAKLQEANGELEKKRLEALERIESLNDTLGLLCDIKQSVFRMQECKERINDKQFLKDPAYRKRMIDSYARIVIEMRQDNASLLKHIDPGEYARLAIAALFERNIELSQLGKECDDYLEKAATSPSAKGVSNTKTIVAEQILPLCRHNNHFLYCIRKLADPAAAAGNRLYDLLLLLKDVEGLHVEYFYNFGAGFVPQEPAEVDADHRAFIKQMVPIATPKENIGFVERLYQSVYLHSTDANLFILYSLMSTIQQQTYAKGIQPSAVFPLWLLKRLDWVRPQVGPKRNKHIKDSVDLAHEWAFANVSMGAILASMAKDPAATVLELVGHLRAVFDFEARYGPASLGVGVVAKAVHGMVKKGAIDPETKEFAEFIFVPRSSPNRIL